MVQVASTGQVNILNRSRLDDLNALRKRSLRAKMRLAHQATSIEEQVSTNTGPRSAARYTNQFSLFNYLWLCSLVDKCLAVDLKDPGLIPSQGDFFFT